MFKNVPAQLQSALIDIINAYTTTGRGQDVESVKASQLTDESLIHGVLPLLVVIRGLCEPPSLNSGGGSGSPSSQEGDDILPDSDSVAPSEGTNSTSGAGDPDTSPPSTGEGEIPDAPDGDEGQDDGQGGFLVDKDAPDVPIDNTDTALLDPDKIPSGVDIPLKGEYP